MGLSSKFRSSKTSSSSNSSSTTSSTTTSCTSSSTNLPELASATTTVSSQSNSPSLRLSKTSSSSSSFKSIIRSISGRSESMDPLKYAPKKFKFRTPDPKYVAMLGAWDMGDNWGANRRGSWQSGVSPCASRRNSICYAEHIEDA